MLLRIDDTDPARNVAGGEDAILDDLALARDRLGRRPRAPERRARALSGGRRGAAASAFQGATLLRDDGTATYQLASVVDDIDFGITHVIRGNDHRPERGAAPRAHAALGAEPPEYVHHGLMLGPTARSCRSARGRVDRRAARRRHPGRGGARVPRGARAAEARRPVRPPAHPPARGRRDRGASGRRARRPCRRARRARPAPCAARATSRRRALARTILDPPAIS